MSYVCCVVMVISIDCAPVQYWLAQTTHPRDSNALPPGNQLIVPAEPNCEHRARYTDMC